ncbi:MAG: DNA topoisomerase (ATP-hydrolyzing) subunit B [SAR202 cluster bacterium]|nr:DNA topoisomerase (ATP-hydrolyzing) subunit B [SAR202 cluster bacterium]|tara:strand:- start:5713 stop:7686 length:1974 start_codon:yes stop_codon:yes gene_type:complete
MTNRNTSGKGKSSSDYTSADIQVLEGMEAVRKRPGMYIGSTDQRGLHHLIYEIVDNAVDEFMAKKPNGKPNCTTIEIHIDAEGKVSVSDDGRGIPPDKHKVTGLSTIETVMTTLHAGGKFDSKAYAVSGGLHGVGASVVNALSTELTVEVKREAKLYRQSFSKGKRLSDLEVSNGFDETEHGTTISFIPDKAIFGTSAFEFDILAQRFKEMAYLNEGLHIIFTSDLHADLIDGQKKVDYQFQGGIAQFVEDLTGGRARLHPEPIKVSKNIEGTIVEAALQYNESFTENVLSFANCINTIDGGTHLTGLRSALTRIMNDYGRKHNVIKENEANLAGEDTREGLAAVISVKLQDPQFEGQTKGKLGNPEIRAQVESALAEEVSIWLGENPKEARRIIEKSITSQRAREAARKARDLIIRKNAMDGGALPGKLADCSDRNPENCELYIVEGDSAGGTAKMGRDRNTQAILPLKGKILNVEKARADKMLAHEEIRHIIIAVGAGMDEEFDLSKLRYHRIIIMTDADVDGSHIRTLLLTFFFRHMPQLIENGHLYIAQPPLYKIGSGKSAVFAYSEGEREGIMLQLKGKRNLNLQRYKGLGEMNAEQLWETTMNPDARTLLQVSVEDAFEADRVFTLLMGDMVAPRREFIETNALDVKNLDV